MVSFKTRKIVLLAILSLLAGNLVLTPNKKTDIAKSADDLYQWQPFVPYQSGTPTNFLAKGSTFPKTGAIGYGNSLYIPDNDGSNAIIWKYNFDDVLDGNMGWSQLNTVGLSGNAFIQDMAVYQNSVGANELWISTHENCTLNVVYRPASNNTCRFIFKNNLSSNTVDSGAPVNFSAAGSPVNYFPYDNNAISSLKFKQFTNASGIKKLYLTTERNAIDGRMGTSILRTQVYGNKNGNISYDSSNWFAAFSSPNVANSGVGMDDASTANYSQGKYMENFSNYLYLTAFNPRTSPNMQDVSSTLYRTSDGTTWSKLPSTLDGKSITNGYFEKVINYQNNLYGQLIVTDSNANKQSELFVKLDNVSGADNTHNWKTVKNFLDPDSGNSGIGAWTVYLNKLYVSSINTSTGAQVWTYDGNNLKLIGNKGLYSQDSGESQIPGNSEVLGFNEYSGTLFALVKNSGGMQLRRMINPNCRWPSDILYLVDRSNSMKGNFKSDLTHQKLDSVKNALKQNNNAINIAGEGSRVAVMTFNGYSGSSTVNTVLNLTADMGAANNAIDTITYDTDSSKSDWHASSIALNAASTFLSTSIALGHRPMIMYISDSVPTIAQDGSYQVSTGVSGVSSVPIKQTSINQYFPPDTVSSRSVVLHDMMNAVNDIYIKEDLYGVKIMPIPIDLPYGGANDFSMDPSYFMANNTNPQSGIDEVPLTKSSADLVTNVKNYYGKYSCSQAQGTLKITLPPSNVLIPERLYLTQAGGFRYEFLVTPQGTNWVYSPASGVTSSPFTITTAFNNPSSTDSYGSYPVITIRGFLPSSSIESLDFRISFLAIDKKNVYDSDQRKPQLYTYLQGNHGHPSAFFSDSNCGTALGVLDHICLRTTLDFNVPGLSRSLQKTLSETIKVPSPSTVGGNVYGQGSVSGYTADDNSLVIGNTVNGVNGGNKLPNYTLTSDPNYWISLLAPIQQAAKLKNPADAPSDPGGGPSGTDIINSPFLYLNAEKSSVFNDIPPTSGSSQPEGKLWYYNQSTIFSNISVTTGEVLDIKANGRGTILVNGDINITSNIICDPSTSSSPTRLAFIALGGNITFSSNVDKIECGAYISTKIGNPSNISPGDGINFNTDKSANYHGIFISQTNINLPKSNFHFTYDSYLASRPTVLLQKIIQLLQLQSSG